MNTSTRRDFIRAAALVGLSPVCRLHAAESGFIQERRAATLRYIETMRFTTTVFGRYRYAADMPEPTLYSSTYAAMTRSLYRDLDTLSTAERDEWIAYLQSHQDDDGLFRDPRIFGQGW